MPINFNIDWTKLGISFAIQVVFLGLILGAMLKQQKLAWKFPGFLGSILLACALVNIPYAGGVIGFVVLLLCITKAIGARTFTDAIFAVGASFALLVIFNLVALQFLVGVLQPPGKVRARTTASASAAPALAETNQPAGTNSPAVEISSNTASAIVFGASPTNAAPAPAVVPVRVPVRPPDPVVDTNQLNSARMAGDIMKHFFVKGVSQGTTISIAMLSNGTRNFDVIVGDTIQLQTSDGRYAAVKCESISEGQVIVSVDGMKVTLFHR
jgi:energy-coupling factor transporter transmembrane protein EcfT